MRAEILVWDNLSESILFILVKLSTLEKNVVLINVMMLLRD